MSLSKQFSYLLPSVVVFLPLFPLTPTSQVHSLPTEKLTAHSCQGRFIFYEGNNLTQDVLGEVSDCFSQFYRLKDFVSNLPRIPNDEARSVRMLKVKARTRLIVYDSPKCSTSDDWTEIYVKVDIQDRMSPSFQIQNYDDEEIAVVWHWHKRNKGLDGKVSCIEVRLE